MGSKTSHRRKHLKSRDPLAEDVSDCVQRRLTKETRAARKIVLRRLKIDSEECD